MIIDIKRTVIKTQLRRLITLIGFTIVILVIVLLGNRQNSFLGFDKYQWGIIIGILYFLTLIIDSVFELNYIFFSDDDDKIILRYFSMSIFNKKKNSIEIPKKLFGGYELLSFLNGMKQKIVLMERVKEKNAKYPPVCLSGLNKNQLKLIITALDKYK